jgi:hypothetical protein
MSFRRHYHHLYDVYSGEVDITWSGDWPSILAVVVLIILTGPMLPLAWWMQHWCAACPWDHEDRWAGTRQFAITLLLLIYVPLISNLMFFHVSLEQLLHFSPAFARSNLLLFVWHTCLRWNALLPLAPTLALISERIDPRTRDLERVLLPGEQLPSSQPPGNAQEAKPARKRTTPNNAGATPKKRKKGRARPLGELLLEEKARREQQAHANQQPQPLPASSGQTPPAAIPAPPSILSSEPSPARKPERGDRESLKDLF